MWNILAINKESKNASLIYVPYGYKPGNDIRWDTFYGHSFVTASVGRSRLDLLRFPTKEEAELFCSRSDNPITWIIMPIMEINHAVDGDDGDRNKDKPDSIPG